MLDLSEDELKILLNALGLLLQEGDSEANENIAVEICRKIVAEQKVRGDPDCGDPLSTDKSYDPACDWQPKFDGKTEVCQRCGLTRWHHCGMKE